MNDNDRQQSVRLKYFVPKSAGTKRSKYSRSIDCKPISGCKHNTTSDAPIKQTWYHIARLFSILPLYIVDIFLFYISTYMVKQIWLWRLSKQTCFWVSVQIRFACLFGTQIIFSKSKLNFMNFPFFSVTEFHENSRFSSLWAPCMKLKAELKTNFPSLNKIIINLITKMETDKRHISLLFQN